MARLEAISPERLTDLAGRMFTQCNPTLAAVGPIDGVMRQTEIAERLGVKATTAAE